MEISTIRLFRRDGSRSGSPDRDMDPRPLRATLRSCGDMVSPVDAVAMVPSLRFITDTGRLRSAGSGSPPFPAFSATMQPSESPASFGLGSGSPRRRPTAVRPLVLGRLARATATGGRWRVVSGSPWHRFSDGGEAGASQVTGPSSARVPRSYTPPGASSPSPLAKL